MLLDTKDNRLTKLEQAQLLAIAARLARSDYLPGLGAYNAMVMPTTPMVTPTTGQHLKNVRAV